MKDTMPEGWQRLTCTCGTDRFAPSMNLRWRQGGGITPEPAGYFCLECHAQVDSASLVQRAQYQAKQRELRELESELAESGTMPTPAKAKKGASDASRAGALQS